MSTDEGKGQEDKLPLGKQHIFNVPDLGQVIVTDISLGCVEEAAERAREAEQNKGRVFVRTLLTPILRTRL